MDDSEWSLLHVLYIFHILDKLTAQNHTSQNHVCDVFTHLQLK